MRQLCFCKVPSILCNGIVVDGENTIDLTNLRINEESSRATPDSKLGSPKSLGAGESTPFTRSLSDIDTGRNGDDWREPPFLQRQLLYDNNRGRK